MTPAEKILKMIEAVDPVDSDTLDEIDARFHGIKCGGEFIEFGIGNYKNPSAIYKDIAHKGAENFVTERDRIPKVTRSRDALKAERSEGYNYSCGYEWSSENGEFAFKFRTAGMWKSGGANVRVKIYGLTEELAELHTIVQVKQWEEENGLSR